MAENQEMLDLQKKRNMGLTNRLNWFKIESAPSKREAKPL